MAVQHIGPIVRRFRRKAGLSQAELARRARLSSGHLCMVESGRRGLSGDSLLRVAAHLDADFLLAARALRPSAA